MLNAPPGKLSANQKIKRKNEKRKCSLTLIVFHFIKTLVTLTFKIFFRKITSLFIDLDFLKIENIFKNLKIFYNFQK